MIALAQVSKFLAVIVMIRVSGAARLEERLVGYGDAPAATTTTAEHNVGDPFTTTVYNPETCYAEFDPSLTSVTLIGTWDLQSSKWVTVPTSTLGWSSYVTPLTTQFTPPPACATQNILPQSYETSSTVSVLVGMTSSCYPPGYLSAAYYSPAICPSGYKAFNMNSATSNHVVLPGTQAYCCPTGYDIRSDPATRGSSLCISSAASSTSKSWTITATSYVYASPQPSSGPRYSETHTTLSGTCALQHIVTPVPIQWQSTDQFVMDWLADANSSSNGTSVINVPVHKPSHNPGAVAGGIIGGLTTLGLIIAGVMKFWLLRRKRPVSLEDKEDLEDQEDQDFKKPFPGPYPGIQEMSSAHEAPRYELDAQHAGVSHELTGSPLERSPMLSPGSADEGRYARSHASLKSEGSEGGKLEGSEGERLEGSVGEARLLAEMMESSFRLH
ncbi:hypothetical protein EJ06DRAFT_557755 [Trichodelitschia bisporula]|uniref:Uncharacterized protein n=1 Tax=Trichodelitschia bisporula TaxID=703511 RepID=A0A6G1HTF3_9PEZI|nr:hypothetical protein EJ06DRAFT_557755 [Trichodelitschia bisporula]